MNDEIVGKIEHNTSEEIGELVKALAKVQGSIKPAKRDSINPYFKAKYADLTSVWDSCRKELSQNNLVVIQTMKSSNGLVTVLTTLAHESGQWIRGEISLKPVKIDPQGYGSALTYARRYSLAAIVGIATGEDDDAEDATRGKRKEKVKTTYLGDKATNQTGKAKFVETGIKLDATNQAEKNEIEKVNKLGEKEVKDEPKVLSEEEAQKEQTRLLEQSKLSEQGKPEEEAQPDHDKEWQDKTRRTWHNLVKRMYQINYFADEESYRAWMKQELNGKISYTKLTDAERVEGIGKMVGYANKYEQEKEK